MTQREKLKELLRETFEYTRGTCIDFDEAVEINADHLLANGVIVPPCKVGDTVYQTDGVRIYELEVLDMFLYQNKPYYETESINFDEYAIGKTVFLTRAEAEKALAERGEGK